MTQQRDRFQKGRGDLKEPDPTHGQKKVTEGKKGKGKTVEARKRNPAPEKRNPRAR